MTYRECDECLVRDLQKLHRLLERKMAERLPEEAREPLLEAKRQMRLALRGLINHTLGERTTSNEKQPVESRCIELE